MNKILTLLVLLLTAALSAYSQVQPNGPPLSATTQGQASLMVGGPHDFTTFGPLGSQGQSNSLCDYCHRAHVPAGGQAAPLWARASLSTHGGTYGVYSSASLDVGAYDSSNGGPHIYAANTSDNYSSFCLSCHDGSAFLAPAAYADSSTPYVFGGWPWTSANSPRTDTAFTFADGGNGYGALSLTHTHPVNFDYDYAAANDGQIYQKASSAYVWLNTSTTPPTATGRLFGGRMQCPSCHNPHFKSGIGLQGSSSKGALCVTCHKK